MKDKIKTEDLEKIIEMKSDWLFISYWNVLNILRDNWLLEDDED